MKKISEVFREHESFIESDKTWNKTQQQMIFDMLGAIEDECNKALKDWARECVKEIQKEIKITKNEGHIVNLIFLSNWIKENILEEDV